MPNPEWQVEVDRATPEDWSGMLSLFNDANIYQTWPYGEIRWGRKNLSHIVLKKDGEAAAMAQLRIVRPTLFNFGMAYLRWGPQFERRGRDLDPVVVMRMAQAIEDEYVRKRKLFLRILPNAFAGSRRAAVIEAALCRFDTEGATPENLYRTFLLDLGPGIEELRRNLDKKWRNQLVRAEKNNLTVSSGTGSKEFQIFRRMYDEMLTRKAFQTNVDVDEFERMQERLAPPHRMRILICERGGTPVAGLVASAMGDSAIYLLGATSDAGLDCKGSYLLQWTLIKRLKETGVRWYDLGGIDPVKNPGVYSYKRGLSGADVVQLSPMAACTSVISSAVVRAGMAFQKTLRGRVEATPTQS
jgi:lipid II:glycine glycyltransferase (peptidoglycan interpeptide bridge formation enzyme)